VILAAGEGSRMGSHTADVPKAFMDLGGHTLYGRQRSVIDGHVDGVTVVLGYAAERVIDTVGDVDTVVVEDWDECDNAESLRRALELVADDVLVLNGDVVVSEAALAALVDRHAAGLAGRNVGGCIPGFQEESTAIRCDDGGIVTDYGMISGHRHAGMGIVDEANVHAVERFLRSRREEWYPVLYPEFETEMVAIPAAQHVEINRPTDLLVAKQKLPLVSSDEADVQT
jgi:choline kinase